MTHGVGSVADARKRIMIVPDCHVQELITETQADNWVRVTGARVWQNGSSVDVMLAPPHNGGQSAVVIALGTVETTRVARTTFQQSLGGRAADRMGKNLVAHLRSNLVIRVPRAAIAANLPPTTIPSLQCSALLVKGKAANGRTYHFQITASGLNKLGVDSEAEPFKKIPTLEHMDAFLRATDDTVVITIRGIGEMTPRNPDSFIDLSATETDFGRPKAVVSLGNSKASGVAGPSGGGMLHANGEMVSYGEGGLRLFYYATETFGDFTLRLQFKIFDPAKHNSGIFVRFPRPTLDFATEELKRRAAHEPAFDPGNPAWK